MFIYLNICSTGLNNFDFSSQLSRATVLTCFQTLRLKRIPEEPERLSKPKFILALFFILTHYPPSLWHYPEVLVIPEMQLLKNKTL